MLSLILNRTNPDLIEHMRNVATDAASPALSFLGRPITTFRNTIADIGTLRDVYTENQDLRETNRRLMTWRDAALRLEAENSALRAQLHVAPDPAIRQVMTRVIGDPSGGFMQSVLLAAGTAQGIEKGQPAITSASGPDEPGLGAFVGRIVQTGDESARLLLITDVNSRIPVVLEQSHIHAIMSGDDSEHPRLMFLPADGSIALGERVLTSGNDRFLPPGIAVGVVTSNDENGVRIQPLADLSRLDFVSVLQYQGAQPLPSPETPASAAHAKKHP
jgi:rod shape-determining protein MreC